MLENTSTVAWTFMVYLVLMLAIGFGSFRRADNRSNNVSEAEFPRQIFGATVN